MNKLEELRVQRMMKMGCIACAYIYIRCAGRYSG
jgi:hypothetical protein